MKATKTGALVVSLVLSYPYMAFSLLGYLIAVAIAYCGCVEEMDRLKK